MKKIISALFIAILTLSLLSSFAVAGAGPWQQRMALPTLRRMAGSVG